MIELNQPATAIVAGRHYTCAITNEPGGQTDDNIITCWLGSGYDFSSHHWEVGFTDGRGAVAVSASPIYSKISGGATVTETVDTYCAISSIGSIGCWKSGISPNPGSYGAMPELGSTIEIIPIGGLGAEDVSGKNFRAISVSVGELKTCVLGQENSASPLEISPTGTENSLRFICPPNKPSNAAGAHGIYAGVNWDSFSSTIYSTTSYSIGDSGPILSIGECLIFENDFSYGNCQIFEQNGPSSNNPVKKILGGDIAGSEYCLFFDDYSLNCPISIGANTNLVLPGDFSVGNRDYDIDSKLNIIDLFPLDNLEWDDTDLDGIGNNFDLDDDNDGYLDDIDIFPHDSTEWNDFDNDGVGDNADQDDDNDSYADDVDFFPLNSSEWLDTDLDGLGDNTDDDDDGDGVNDEADLFPLDPTEWNDTDLDGIGDNMDFDDDDDGLDDIHDDFPLHKCAVKDTDSDGFPDFLSGLCSLEEDDDDDNDSIPDREDRCPSGNLETMLIGWISEKTTDFDGDGCRDIDEDPDDDGDGVDDYGDLFPLDSTEWYDFDGDGIGNNADNDDDNDGVEDTTDVWPYELCFDTDTDQDGLADQINDGCELVLQGDEYYYYSGNEYYSENIIDGDDDNDGILDNLDAYPLDANRYLPESKDNVNYNNLMIPILLVVISVLLIVIVIIIRGNRKKNISSESLSKESADINNLIESYVKQMVASGYDENAARQYAEQFYSSHSDNSK